MSSKVPGLLLLGVLCKTILGDEENVIMLAESTAVSHDTASMKTLSSVSSVHTRSRAMLSADMSYIYAYYEFLQNQLIYIEIYRR